MRNQTGIESTWKLQMLLRVSQNLRKQITCGIAVIVCVTVLAERSTAQPIDRYALVHRHNVVITNADPLTPLSVGNGEFAFTADITGLQTFPEFHEKGMLLSTMSQWGWHSFPNPENYTLEDVLVSYDTHGRMVPYADGPVGDESAAGRSARARAANSWLRANPHRLDLAHLGFVLTHADGSTVAITELTDVQQTLDLWTGLLTSQFNMDGQSVKVETVCHPTQDIMAVQIESPLLPSGQAKVCIGFPYAAGDWMKAADWSNPDKHQTVMSSKGRVTEFEHIMDTTRYHVAVEHAHEVKITKMGPHQYAFTVEEKGPAVLEFVVAFSPGERDKPLPKYNEVKSASEDYWSGFWNDGGAIDLSASSDPRWRELERRIVLSQYLTAINSAGSMPPQETGLVENSWFGKPHLEMHWWHAAHFPLWGREALLERSMGWYTKILPEARGLASSQGYEGVRWPKMTDPVGAQTPSSIAVFLIWEQPHPIFYAELMRRVNPSLETLEKYQDLVFETANFMADFAWWDEERQRFVLGPPVIPAQESYGNERARIFNPTYELAYWEWALNIAQEWREGLGMTRLPAWDRVATNLSKPTVRDGVYAAIETPPYTIYKDHPSMLCALGVLPKTSLIDEGTMKATLDHVFEVWDWPSTWGWDYPVIAMTAARVGEPERAIDALFLDTPKNGYLANGHNYQRPNLPLYLPGNGGLLYATALMAAGWDGAPTNNAPGFPSKGWMVRHEGLRPAP